MEEKYIAKLDMNDSVVIQREERTAKVMSILLAAGNLGKRKLRQHKEG